MSNEQLAPLPVREAFEAYKLTDDYQNTRRWALHEKHVDGSLWAAWHAGFSENEARLRALLAERDALRERDQKITHLRDYHRNESGKLQRKLRSISLWASTEDDYLKIEAVRQKMHEHNERADALQSILNATLSEGERG